MSAKYNVPCNGCTRCCHNDSVRLLPSDNSFEYETEPHPYMPGELMLAHKSNHDCIYLGEKGCTIQTTKPLMCREMDCRNIANALTYTQARKSNLRIEVWKRGKELLRK